MLIAIFIPLHQSTYIC